MQRHDRDREQIREWADEHGLEHLVDECSDAELDDVIEVLEDIEERENEEEGGQDRDWPSRSSRICWQPQNTAAAALIHHMDTKENVRLANETKTDLPVMLDVEGVAVLLGIGRSKAYELCRQPGFPVLRLGKQLRIPRHLLLQWIDEQARFTESNGETPLSLN